MASFLVYAPITEPISGRELLARCGLSSLVADSEPDPSPVVISGTGGPDGQSGVLLLPYCHGDNRDPAVMFRPELQTWQKVNFTQPFWIGWENQNAPQSHDLLRPTHYAGAAIELRGSKWLVPYCFASRIRWGLDVNGDPCVKREPLIDSLFQLAVPAFKRLELHFTERIRGENPEYDLQQALVDAVAILASNYRITVAIALAIGLLSTPDIVKVIARATDFDRIADLQAIAEGSANG